MSNPYQPFFDKIDQSIAALSGRNDELKESDYDQAADLLKRAGFVLANLLNLQAQVYPTLFFEPEPSTISNAVDESSRTSEGVASDDPVEGEVTEAGLGSSVDES